jgi:Uma2 family endonuclease
MPSVPVPQPTLYEALLALPENLVGEIIDGELYTQPHSSGPHGLAESGLNIELGGPFHKGRGGPGGWWIIVKPEVHFKRDTEVAVPDLAGWRRERMPAIPQGHRYEAVPDWVCEILSPGTAKKDRSKKLPLYARYGVVHAWLADPLERTLKVFELRGGFWVLLGTLQNEEPVSMPSFDAVTFSLAELWT